MKSECAGLLRLRNLGGNLVLIHGVLELATSEALRGLDDWTQHWFEWWREWQASDVNHSRTVWTRWIGVPLNAWSARFFESGCQSFGRMGEIHELTEKKTRLEAAFVKVETDCPLVNWLLNGTVDGERFSIRIDELPPSLEAIKFGSDYAVDLSSNSDLSEWESWPDGDSVAARLVSGRESAGFNERSVNEGSELSIPDTYDEKAVGSLSLRNHLASVDFTKASCSSVSVGPEENSNGNSNIPSAPLSVRNLGPGHKVGECDFGPCDTPLGQPILNSLTASPFSHHPSPGPVHNFSVGRPNCVPLPLSPSQQVQRSPPLLGKMSLGRASSLNPSGLREGLSPSVVGDSLLMESINVCSDSGKAFVKSVNTGGRVMGGNSARIRKESRNQRLFNVWKNFVEAVVAAEKEKRSHRRRQSRRGGRRKGKNAPTQISLGVDNLAPL